jgi:hypothetical protein
VRATVTDATGRYAIDGLAPGRHRIQASMNGFETKVATMPLLAGRDGDWSGALLLAGAAIGEGSIERKVLGETGWDAVDCGRHAAAASQAALQRSLTCALVCAGVRQPLSIIVQSVADGSRGGHGLLAGSDGIIHRFEYEKGGLRFRRQRCQFPDVTRRESGAGFEFTCQP